MVDNIADTVALRVPASAPRRRWIAPTALAASSIALTTVLAAGGHLPAQPYVLLVLAACGGYGVMVAAERRWGGLGLGFVGASVIVPFTVGIVAPPRVTADLWWYAVYGRIVAVHHASPYTHVAADFPYDTVMRSYGHAWRHTPSVYGPLFTAFSAATSAGSGSSMLSTRLAYQVLALAAVLTASVIVWRRTRSAGAVAFLAAHPMVALYIVNGGRNDILVGVAMLGAAVLASQGRERSAGVVGGLGALVKLTGLVGIVALVVTLATARGRGAAQRAAAAALAVVSAGYLVAGSAAVLTPMNTAGAMFSRGSVWKLATRVVVPSPHLALAVLGVVVVVVLLRTRWSAPATSMTATLTALTLGAAYTLPAYVAWALPPASLDHRSKVSRIAATQGLVLVAGYGVFRHPFAGPAGVGLWWAVRAGVPLVSLVLLVQLTRAVRRTDQVPDPRGGNDIPPCGEQEALMPMTLVVIPTYNERENLEEVLTRTRAAVPDADILVVDDASPDGTAELAETFGVTLGRVTVLRRTGNRGLGLAYRDGFRLGLARGYEVIIEMDADLSHDPAAIPTLVARVHEGADLAIGSRYVTGGSTPSWAIGRRALSRAGCRYARSVLRVPVRDLTSGFRAYRANVLERIDLDTIDATGYGFQIEIAYAIALSGGTIVEVPITFRNRTAGISKMSPAIVAEAMILVTRCGIRDRIHRSPWVGSAEASHAL